MAARPLWEGDLRLSLVSCPVALFGATNRASDVSFHLLHKKTHHRIRMIPHDPKLGAVERADLVKGYEFSPGEYVILTPAEIAAVRLPSTRVIDIEEFVDEDQIDRIYWNDPYFMVPRAKNPNPAYQVIRDAMAESGKIAIGRLVMHSRKRVVALEARGRGLLLTTLRSRDEVRDEAEFFDDIPATKGDRKMIEIAEKIIEQQAAKFNPSDFEDRYETALRDLIKRKRKGAVVVEEKRPPKDENVIDLMDALKRSLAGKGGNKSHAGRVLKAHTKSAAKAKPKAKRKAGRAA